MVQITGTPFAAFSDLMLSTPEAYASGPDDFAVYMPRKRWLLKGMMAHSAMGSRTFTGTTVKDTFVDTVTKTGRYRRPNGEVVFSMPQHFKEWSVMPALFLDYIAWTEWELESNGIVRDLQGGVLRNRLKNLKMKKYRMQRIGQAEQFETDLLAPPDYAAMEGASAYKPRSIFAYYNEGLPSAWTTVQTLDPTVVTEFSCQNVTANYNTGLNTSAWEGFLGLDILMKNSEYDPIPFDNQNQTPQAAPQKEWLVSLWGEILLRQQLRAANDQIFYDKHDAGKMTPMHGGIPIRQVTELNTAAVWKEASTSNYTATEKTADITGPRFILFDYAAYQARFHATKYFQNHPVREAPNIVGTKIMPIETWWMTFSMDPRSGGVLSPATADLAAPTGV